MLPNPEIVEQIKPGTRLYVAIPYSGVEEHSFKVANKATASLMNDGYVPYSPITHNHVVATKHQLPGNWEFWKAQDIPYIEHFCEAVIVVGVWAFGEYNPEDEYSSWKYILKSVGVQAEIQAAIDSNKPVYLYCYITNRFLNYEKYKEKTLNTVDS